MTHFTVTPEPRNRMPKQQGLLRRGAAQRIIKGLFNHQIGKPLAQGYVAIGRFTEHPDDALFLHEPSVSSQLALLDSAPIQERGNGTLRFKIKISFALSL